MFDDRRAKNKVEIETHNFANGDSGDVTMTGDKQWGYISLQLTNCMVASYLSRIFSFSQSRLE